MSFLTKSGIRLNWVESITINEKEIPFLLDILDRHKAYIINEDLNNLIPPNNGRHLKSLINYIESLELNNNDTLIEIEDLEYFTYIKSIREYIKAIDTINLNIPIHKFAIKQLNEIERRDIALGL